MNKQLTMDLICNALEGGSNYWYMIVEHNKKVAGVDYLHEIPLRNNGFIAINHKEEGGIPSILCVSSIKKGWKVIKEKYPQHYHDAINDNHDAVTADVFLQCCLFGGVIYG